MPEPIPSPRQGECKPKRRYRMVDSSRVMVVEHLGFEGFNARWVDSCAGCFEAGECMGNAHNYPVDPKHNCHIGAGCEDCGYTGKRRQVVFIAFDEPAFQKHLDDLYRQGKLANAD